MISFKRIFSEDVRENLYMIGYKDVSIGFQNIEKANESYEQRNDDSHHFFY